MVKPDSKTYALYLLRLRPLSQADRVSINVEVLPPQALVELYDLVVLGLRGARDSPFRAGLADVGTGFSRRLRELERQEEPDWKGRWTWDMVSRSSLRLSIFSTRSVLQVHRR